jgi:hypothetical protein
MLASLNPAKAPPTHFSKENGKVQKTGSDKNNKRQERDKN